MTNYAFKFLFLEFGNLRNISGFGIIYKFHFDKVSLNAASCQTANSTVSVCTSKEPELKGFKQLSDDQI